MLRISTTTLESFRLFCQPDQEWMSEADLLATIRGEVTETPELRIGRAFDRILERPAAFAVEGGYETEGAFFPESAIRRASALFDPAGVWQVRGQRVYGDAVVVGKADFVHGGVLHENKTTFGTFDVEKYLESCQWRFYVALFAPAVVTYNVFRLADDKATGAIDLAEIHSFRVWPYARLAQDCAALVDRFVAYVRRRDLAGLLEARQAAQEGAFV